MASRFRSWIPYVVPGALALLGCWWLYSHRKQHASCHDQQEEQQEEVPETGRREARVPGQLPLSSEEQCVENETATWLLSAELTTPSLLRRAHGRPDLSQDLPELAATTIQPSTLEEGSEKRERMGRQDESRVPACASLPLISESTEGHSGAAVSLAQDSRSSAKQEEWPSASVEKEADTPPALLSNETPPIVEHSGDSKVPYRNGTLKEAGPDSHQECGSAAGMGGDHLGGLDGNGMDSVDSGCAMRKAVTRQTSKPGGESSKSDIVIWEIEVPKECVGRLIGKQGRFMSFLRQSSGAKIYVSTLPYFHDSQVCHIEEGDGGV